MPFATTLSPPVDHGDATRALYAAFADVAFRHDMVRCGHCVSDADVAALSGPVASLDPGVVARFLVKAGTTWGDSDDLRRVAPRALHLAAEQALPVHRTVVLAQLARAGWSRWPEPQVDAVCRFLLAEWSRLLRSPARPGHAAHRWLRQTATVVADLDPFLATWHDTMASEAGPASVHLAVLLVNSELRPDFPASVHDLFDSPAADPGACPATEPPTASVGALADQLGAWLTTTATEAHLQRAASDLADTVHARRLSLAVERLRRFHAVRERV